MEICGNARNSSKVCYQFRKVLGKVKRFPFSSFEFSKTNKVKMLKKRQDIWGGVSSCLRYWAQVFRCWVVLKSENVCWSQFFIKNFIFPFCVSQEVLSFWLNIWTGKFVSKKNCYGIFRPASILWIFHQISWIFLSFHVSFL